MLTRSSCLTFRRHPAGRCASSLNLRNRGSVDLVDPSTSTTQSIAYLAALRVAATSAAEPAFVAESPMYDSTKGQTTVTSQVSGFPSL